jgi:hypothetical protein
MMCPDASWGASVFASSASLSSEETLAIGKSSKWKGARQQDLRNTSHIINVIAQRDEEVKEQLRAAGHHLHLHGTAALEGAAAADDEREVVGSELRVGVRCVGVGVAGGGEDCAALDAGFYHMLASFFLFRLKLI